MKPLCIFLSLMGLVLFSISCQEIELPEEPPPAMASMLSTCGNPNPIYNPGDVITMSDTLYTTESCGTLIIDGVTFDGAHILITNQLLGTHNEGMGYDTVIVRNSSFLSYGPQGVRIRGNHKYVLIENNHFYNDIPFGAEHQDAITATTEVGSTDVVGEMIVRNNIFEGISQMFFGQKLSKLTIQDNCAQLNLPTALPATRQAIKIDNASGLSPNDNPTDILIEGNTLDVSGGTAAITLESHTTTNGFTRGAVVKNNWMNHRFWVINAAPETLVENNTFDFTNKSLPAGANSTHFASTVRDEVSFNDNKFIFADPSQTNNLKVGVRVLAPEGDYQLVRNEPGTYGAFLGATQGGSEDFVPVGLTSTIIEGAPDGARITWDYLAGGFSQYIVEYTTSPTFAYYSTATRSNNFFQFAIANNATFYVRVRAVKTFNGDVTAPSQVITVRNDRSPSNFTSTITPSSSQDLATINWGAIENATSYKVDYSTSPTFAYYTTSTRTVTNFSFPMAFGSTFYIRVRSVVSGVESPNSHTYLISNQLNCQFTEGNL